MPLSKSVHKHHDVQEIADALAVAKKYTKEQSEYVKREHEERQKAIALHQEEVEEFLRVEKEKVILCVTKYYDSKCNDLAELCSDIRKSCVEDNLQAELFAARKLFDMGMVDGFQKLRNIKPELEDMQKYKMSNWSPIRQFKEMIDFEYSLFEYKLMKRIQKNALNAMETDDK